MSTRFSTFESNGFDCLVTVKIDPLSNVTTLAGSLLQVFALNIASGNRLEGVAILEGDGSVVNGMVKMRIIYAPWVLLVGNYKIHLDATPSGFGRQTVAKCMLEIMESAASRP